MTHQNQMTIQTSSERMYLTSPFPLPHLQKPLELQIRLEEIRLLESRRSARLADQERDTDFARLADMAGDRRRASHNIDVPMTMQQQQTQQQQQQHPMHMQQQQG